MHSSPVHSDFAEDTDVTHDLTAGALVSVWWGGTYQKWFSGTVEAVGPHSFLVQYDDGEKAYVDLDREYRVHGGTSGSSRLPDDASSRAARRSAPIASANRALPRARPAPPLPPTAARSAPRASTRRVVAASARIRSAPRASTTMTRAPITQRLFASRVPLGSTPRAAPRNASNRTRAPTTPVRSARQPTRATAL